MDVGGGWDDPAKLICDFFYQPELPVGGEHWDSFVDILNRTIDFKSSTVQRSAWLLPAYQIKWCCIMLNKFLPGGKARREFSLGENLAERKHLQLKKVGQLLTRASSGIDQR